MRYFQFEFARGEKEEGENIKKLISFVKNTQMAAKAEFLQTVFVSTYENKKLSETFG